MTNASVETSLGQPLVERAEAVAGEMNISPDHLFRLAVEDFIERYPRNRQAMEELHQAEENDPGEMQRQWQAFTLETQRQLHRDAQFEQKNPDRLSDKEFEELVDQSFNTRDFARNATAGIVAIDPATV